MHPSNHRGFVAYYAIILMLVFTILAFTVSRIIETNRGYLEYHTMVVDSENTIRDR